MESSSEREKCHRRRRRKRRSAMNWPLHWLSLAPAVLAMMVLVPGAAAMPFEEQRFAMEPQDQTAVEGTKVTLPCRVINKSGTLQWTKDDFGLGTHRNLSGFERYTMVGSDEEGDFSLEMNPVILDDDARYQCQVGPGPQGQPGVRSRFARLTVLVAPEPPRIIQGSSLQTTEDREMELECVSDGGKPAAEITWIDGDGVVLTEGISYSKEPLSDSRRFTARSVLKLTPKKKHHNTTFICQAQNTADRMARSAGLRLEVKYAPKVTVSVVEGATSSGRIPEGSTVRLFCHADANPSDLTYKWFLDDEPIGNGATTELVLTNVTRALHDAIVKCQVHNAVGKSEESETLDITYGPQFRQRPISINADPAQTVTMTCDVDGNPPPDILWIHSTTPLTERIVGNSANLTFVADYEREGQYYCKASVQGFPELGAAAELRLNGKPHIKSERTQWGHVGNEARVECLAVSIPRHERVTWNFNNVEVTRYDHDYHFLEDTLPEGIRSTLIIKESQEHHYGTYNCSVTNAYGTDSAEIRLEARKTLPMLVILTGVIGGVIVIIALTMVVILCQKKVKKPPACTPPVVDSHEAEKQCRESDRSSNISDMKLELRTGSSVSRPGSETGSERGGGGVPLAGPVHLPLSSLNGGDHMYRYPTDYPDSTFPPKSISQKDGQNNNGYVPYVDYTRDYAPPLSMLQIGNMGPLGSLGPVGPMGTVGTVGTVGTLGTMGNNISTLDGGLGIPTSRCPSTATSPLSTVDPRYSAAYGNPYLRTSSVSLLPPHTSPAPSASPSTASTGPLGTVMPTGPPNGPPPPPPYSAVRNGAAPQVARLPNSPTSQYIVPSSQMATIKRGTLATHV